MSLDEKKDIVHNRLRSKLEKELQDQEIAIENYKLKYEISQQENTVLKQSYEWVTERLEFLYKRWLQLADKVSQNVSNQALADFIKQVLQAESKIKKKASQLNR